MYLGSAQITGMYSIVCVTIHFAARTSKGDDVTSIDDDGSICSVEMILHNYKFSRVSSPLNSPCGMTIELSFAKFISD